MSKMIQVRHVPDEVHTILKARAAAEGMSLSDFVKRDLEQAAARPSLQEIDARVGGRGRSGLRTEAIVEALRAVREH